MPAQPCPCLGRCSSRLFSRTRRCADRARQTERSARGAASQAEADPRVTGRDGPPGTGPAWHVNCIVCTTPSHAVPRGRDAVTLRTGQRGRRVCGEEWMTTPDEANTPARAPADTLVPSGETAALQAVSQEIDEAEGR